MTFEDNDKSGMTNLRLAGIFVFAALALVLLVNLFRLYYVSEKTSSLRSLLDAAERETAGLSREITDADADIDYLTKLAGMYPQNKGHFRTQNAIAGEVRELRKKVEKKVGGRLHIVVDSKANKLYLKQGMRLLWEADCSVGKGGTLKDKKTGRIWEFATPRGEFTVRYKIDHPAWIKPDWAYVENGEPVPPKDDPARLIRGELGAYALDIGNGYLIHGTKNVEMLGNAVSHGCVRLGTDALEKLYKSAPVGAKVYIY